VAFSPDGKTAYVTNLQASSVSVIDVATNTVNTTTPTITVRSGPEGVAFSPDGKTAYVTNSFDASVSVIDVATNTVNAVTPTITVATNPTGVAFSPDGKTAYVTNAGSNTVSVIDVATNTVAFAVNVQRIPYRVAFSPDGKIVYVANKNSNTVSVLLAPAAPQITSAAPGGGTVGVGYSFTVTASGNPAPSFTVTAGMLPAGLVLDKTTGVISGTPTMVGSSTFTVTAENGVTPAVSAGYLVSVDPALVVVVPTSVSKLGATGANALPQLFTAGMLIAVGVGMMLLTRRRRHRRV
jgi:YVTN family beta-propeller protein